MLLKNLSSPFHFIFFLLYISQTVLHAQTSEELKEKIKRASSFDDIFKLEKSITLQAPKEVFIGIIQNLVVRENGDLIIRIEGAGILKVLVFDKDGAFKNPIGSAGYDKEDYLSPWSIAMDSHENVYVLDQANSRVNIFEINNVYKGSFSYKMGSLHMHINSKDEIFLYCGVNQQKQYDCIVKFNSKGKKVTQFAPFPKEIIPVKFYSFQNTMAIDKKGFVYEANPLWSNIRKYNSDGKFITEFGSKQVSDYRNADNIGVEKKAPRAVDGLFILEDILMLVYDDNKMDIYDIDGELLNRNVKISHQIIYSSDNEIYAVSTGRDKDPGLLRFTVNE